MKEKNLFEYAVIRLVPRVDREEFINVGVILYCAKQKFLKCLVTIDEDKLAVLAENVAIDEVKTNLEAIHHICCGGKIGGPIGLLDLPSRFRWLTATRSTVVQSSKVHPGFCSNAEDKLQQLFEQLVL